MVSYQLGNYNNSLFDSEAYLQAVDFAHWDTESRNGACAHPRAGLHRLSRLAHAVCLYRWAQLLRHYRRSRARKILGTLFLDLRTDVFDRLFATLNLTDGGIVYVTDDAGHCYFSSDTTLVGETLDVTADAPDGTMLLSERSPNTG